MFSLPDSDAPRLLVSVRNVEEAVAAVAGGADIVDVKEPSRGALGRADDATIGNIVDAVRRAAPGTPTSAALGELADDEAVDPTRRLAPDLVKVGLAGMADVSDWPHRLERWSDGRADWVGVVYADWQPARAPEPDEVVSTVLKLGAAGVLFDTFDKAGGTLLDVTGENDLAHWIEQIRRQNRFVALAGRVGPRDLPQLRELRPDIVAVRSAVCAGGNRGSMVEEQAVRHFRDSLAPSPLGERVGVRGP